MNSLRQSIALVNSYLRYYYLMVIPWLGMLMYVFSLGANKGFVRIIWGGWMAIAMYYYLITPYYHPRYTTKTPSVAIFWLPIALLTKKLFVPINNVSTILTEDVILEVSAIGSILILLFISKLFNDWTTIRNELLKFILSFLLIGLLVGGSCAIVLFYFVEAWQQTFPQNNPINSLILGVLYISRVIFFYKEFSVNSYLIDIRADDHIVSIAIAPVAWILVGSLLFIFINT